MQDSISGIERRILAVIQEGLPISQSPYEDIARRAGIKTAELLAVLKDWKRQGKLRRIGAVANHFKIGLGSGAMVVWQVKPERIEEVGQILAEFKEVSHAYERHIDKNWPYNIYTMVHGKNAEDVMRTVKRMSQACSIPNYRILTTEKELKKTPPVYIRK